MRLYVLLLLGCGLCLDVQAADVSVSGNWNRTVNDADLAGGAGSDLVTPIESSTTLTTVDITATAGGSWTLKVSRSDSNWPAGVSLAVKRISDGSGSGTISGGTAYLTITGTEQTFFTGSDDRTGIKLQLKTESLSVQHVPDSYSTSITYSIQ